MDRTALELVVDGDLLRTLDSSNTPSGYPQTPMALRIGSWAGGDPSNNEGTILWAGGLTNYDAGPFTFTLQSLLVQDYSTGSEYTYGDHSGTWTSIQAVGGKVYGYEMSDDEDYSTSTPTERDQIANDELQNETETESSNDDGSQDEPESDNKSQDQEPFENESKQEMEEWDSEDLPLISTTLRQVIPTATNSKSSDKTMISKSQQLKIQPKPSVQLQPLLLH